MKFIPPFGYLAIVVLYFFSFAQFNCSGIRIADIRGIDMVAGTDVGYETRNENVEVSLDEGADGVIWAKLAFAAAVVGFVGSAIALLARTSKFKFFSIVLSAGGVLSTFITKVHIDTEVKGNQGVSPVMVHYQPAFWFTLILFILVFVISLVPRKKKRRKQRESSAPDILMF